MTRYIFLINKIYEKGGVLDVSAAHPYQKKFEVAPPRVEHGKVFNHVSLKKKIINKHIDIIILIINLRIFIK